MIIDRRNPTLNFQKVLEGLKVAPRISLRFHTGDLADNEFHHFRRKNSIGPSTMTLCSTATRISPVLRETMIKQALQGYWRSTQKGSWATVMLTAAQFHKPKVLLQFNTLESSSSSWRPRPITVFPHICFLNLCALGDVPMRQATSPLTEACVCEPFRTYPTVPRGPAEAMEGDPGHVNS